MSQKRKDRTMFEAARKFDVAYWKAMFDKATAELDMAQEHINRSGVNLALAMKIIGLEEDRAYYKRRMQMARNGVLLPYRGSAFDAAAAA